MENFFAVCSLLYIVENSSIPAKLLFYVVDEAYRNIIAGWSR